jgi:hypothetical protein
VHPFKTLRTLAKPTLERLLLATMKMNVRTL